MAAGWALTECLQQQNSLSTKNIHLSTHVMVLKFSFTFYKDVQQRDTPSNTLTQLFTVSSIMPHRKLVRADSTRCPFSCMHMYTLADCAINGTTNQDMMSDDYTPHDNKCGAYSLILFPANCHIIVCN